MRKSPRAKKRKIAEKRKKKATATRAPRKLLKAKTRRLKGPIESIKAPPAAIKLAGDPAKGSAADQAKLKEGNTLEGAAKLYAGSCAGGDTEANNCAHFLSDALIRCGYSELELASKPPCVNARCAKSAKRPIRAKDMNCWFKSKATKTGKAVQKNTGFWAVFQLDENEYVGGHVVIVDSDNWKFYGTGWHGAWDQTSYQWK